MTMKRWMLRLVRGAMVVAILAVCGCSGEIVLTRQFRCYQPVNDDCDGTNGCCGPFWPCPHGQIVTPTSCFTAKCYTDDFQGEYDAYHNGCPAGLVAGVWVARQDLGNFVVPTVFLYEKTVELPNVGDYSVIRKAAQDQLQSDCESQSPPGKIWKFRDEPPASSTPLSRRFTARCYTTLPPANGALCKGSSGGTPVTMPICAGSGGISSQSAGLVFALGTVVAPDDDKVGVAIGAGAPTVLQFDRGAQALQINNLSLPMADFVFDGEARVAGTATLVGRVAATAVPNDPSAYSIPQGAAKFLIGSKKTGDSADGYVIESTNATPLVLFGLDDPIGPHLMGTLTGTLKDALQRAHRVDATVSAQFAWSNRPPVANLQVSQTIFSSADSAAATDHACPDGSTAHYDAKAKTIVRLDGTKSKDPDPGQTLIYAWDVQGGVVVRNQQGVAAVLLPAGNYTAYLTVQDDYGVAATTGVAFTVYDSARTTGCGIKATRFTKEPKASDFVPAVPVEPVYGVLDFSHAQSEKSIPVSKTTLKEMKDFTKDLGGKSSIGSHIFKYASQPFFKQPGIHDQVFPDPFAGLCPASTVGLTGGLKAVCSGCGNGVCAEGETCATCAKDCGACKTCGDGRCDDNETCTTCPVDCGECPKCGDGRCRAGERTSSCPADCYCGNGTCDAGENSTSCPSECYCGNSTCDFAENGTQCPSDCYCGNHTCDSGENSNNCPTDCAAPPVVVPTTPPTLPPPTVAPTPPAPCGGMPPACGGACPPGQTCKIIYDIDNYCGCSAP